MLWRCAVPFLHWLLKRDWRGSRCLELGSGTGLISIALAKVISCVLFPTSQLIRFRLTQVTAETFYYPSRKLIILQVDACITATDQAQLVPLLEENVTINASDCAIDVEAFKWSKNLGSLARTRWDFIICSDLLFYEGNQE